MAKGKWIPELHPGASLDEAAKKVLSTRLGVVLHYLPLAIDHADEDIEHVHQLRVSTRRSVAALRLFSVCLPKKKLKKAKKLLDVIRDAAGEARDLDVFLLHLFERRAKTEAEEHRPVIDWLIGYSRAQRELAQTHLHKLKKKKVAQIESLLSELPGEVQPPEDLSIQVLQDLAQPQARECLTELNEILAAEHQTNEQLHQVRILGKRLRYMMELTFTCFDEPFKTVLYPKVEKMQKMLGNANDSHVTQQRLETIRQEFAKLPPVAVELYEPGLNALVAYHQARIEKLKESFALWRADWRTDWRESKHAL